MIVLSEMYAPYRLFGASVRFVPFQATSPPPHARLAKITFSNHLHPVEAEYQNDQETEYNLRSSEAEEI
jgi:hypothetical protein